MNSIAEAARTHMRKMEVRIAEQTVLIAKLKANGRDAAEPTRTLVLLRKALDDMRFQLGRLLPAMEPHARAQSPAGPIP